MDSLSTQELVGRLKRSGLPASVAGLRQDVHRGLISPLMPSNDTPGRGMPARWSPMSIRRARRMARLRQRGVNGKVLPLLLFLADGWGWLGILPGLQEACAKSGELDRRHMGRHGRVRTRDDLVDNASQVEEWMDRPDWREIRQFRTWLYTASWFGDPEPGSNPTGITMATLRDLPGPPVAPEQLAELEVLSRRAAATRAALLPPATEMDDWLASLDPASVERGRVVFWRMVRLARWLRRLGGLPGSNPLTLGGMTPAQIAANLRASPGRPTPAQILGACIVQAMAHAKVEEALGVATVAS